MPIKQNSKIEVRSGLQQNLPQLGKGEFGWCIDTQQLYIGNGTVADGAPLPGNSQIVTTTAPLSSLILIDTVTGNYYRLTVTNGNLIITLI